MVRMEVFDHEPPIGGGSFSAVYKGTMDSQPIAVKRLISRKDGEYFSEVNLLSQLNHENIVCCLEFYPNYVGTYDLILELAEGGKLSDALRQRNLRLSWKRSTIYQISNGLAYLHQKGILHLDLKPPNILFKDRSLQRVLIADFGMATKAAVVRRAAARNFKARDDRFTHLSDVFSLAAISCCIFAGRNSRSREETDEIISFVLEELDFEHYPSWFTALERGVSPTASRRPNAVQFRNAFDNPAPEPLIVYHKSATAIGKTEIDRPMAPANESAPNILLEILCFILNIVGSLLHWLFT